MATAWPHPTFVGLAPNVSVPGDPSPDYVLTGTTLNGPLTGLTEANARLAAESAAFIRPADGREQRILDMLPSLYWPLTKERPLLDLSGWGRNPTAVGGVSVGQFADGPYAPGAQDTATDFDGTDDYFTSTYSPYVNGATRTFTGWAYRDSSSGYRSFMGSLEEVGLIRIRGDGTTRDFDFVTDPLQASVVWANAWPGNNQWVHWAVVANESANLVSLYINGILVSTQTMALEYPVSSGFRVGWGGGALWDGKMAHIAVFERALTAAEILTLADLR